MLADVADNTDYKKLGIDIEKAENDFADKGCLVSISIHKPTLRAQLSWSEIGIPEDVNILASAPSTKPPSGYNNFTRLEQAMRNTIKRYSVGGMEGFRFMPWENFEKCLAEVIPYKEEYEAHVPIFLESYEDEKEKIIVAWRDKAGEIWDNLQDGAHISRDDFIARVEGRLRKSLPVSAALTDRFSVGLKSLQFSVGKGAKVENAPLTLKYAKQMAKDTFQEFFMEVATDLRERTAEVTGKVLEVMQKNGKITEKSLKPLRDYIKLFSSLNVIDDSEVENHLNKLKKLLEENAEGLNKNSNNFVNFGYALKESAGLINEQVNKIATEKMHTMYGGGGVKGRKFII